MYKKLTKSSFQVLIVGAVIALVAQFVTLACVFRRLKTRPDDYASLIILNAEVASAVSNLTFMLGIQVTLLMYKFI